jgi:hypothetical protein
MNTWRPVYWLWVVLIVVLLIFLLNAAHIINIHGGASV